MARSPLPPGLGPEFSFGDARRAGVSRRRLDAPDLTAEFRGSRGRVRPPAAGDVYAQRFAALLDRCRAFLPVAPRDFRFSHVTAALIHRIPLPPALEAQRDLDVTVAGSTGPRRSGIIAHRVATLPESASSARLPVFAVEQVWLQLSTVLELDDLIVAGDHLVRRKSPASSLAKLTDAVHAAAGRPGAARARLALAEIRPGTDSPRESRLRLLIVRAGFPEPVIGHTVIYQGYFVGTPDLAFVRERIALDYDGQVHRDDERTYVDDVERRQLFADANWRYITVTRENLRVPHSLLSRLDRLLRERGPR